jgi:hypothetical protein
MCAARDITNKGAAIIQRIVSIGLRRYNTSKNQEVKSKAGEKV